METRATPQLITTGVTRLELPAHTLPPFTHTNSYIIASEGEAVLIDPGFYEETSLEVIIKALQGNVLKAILLTHTHPDHIEGLSLVRERYPDVPVYVHAVELRKLQELGKLQELSNLQHVNVKTLNAETSFYVGSLELCPIFTPGHSPGHLSFYLPSTKLALVGDVVAGFGSIWIGTPDGNINHYFRSLETLSRLELAALAPGHGEVITEPYTKLAEVKEHRLQRLVQVKDALHQPLSLADLREIVYPDPDPRLGTLAQQSLLALLEKLESDEAVTYDTSTQLWTKL
jgi:endoribonuclease LACTB2